jgi:hypothetical protein
MNFEVIIKKIHINKIKDVPTNFEFFTICANHNEQHNGI